MIARAVALITLALVGQGACAAPLAFELPYAARATHDETSADSFALPVGVFTDGSLPVKQLEGTVTRRAWQVPGQAMTTLQLLSPLRDELESAGFTSMMECESDACGGFDFRFAADVIAAPDMYVDLFNFRAFSARRGTGDGAEYVFLLVSRAATAGYVQLVHVSAGGLAGVPVIARLPEPDDQVAMPVPANPELSTELAARLMAQGHVVLGDLIFDTGAVELAEAPYASLNALADFLKADPARHVVLVGHTDTAGSLEGNIALSRRRAEAVLERLAARLDVPRAQMSAEGVGYLAPMTSNQTPDGREANRRVEAVLLDQR